DQMAAQAWSVLKVTCRDEVHRLPIQGKPDLQTVSKKLGAIWADDNGSTLVAKYLDDEGDWCTLVEATFADFISTARPQFPEERRPVLRLKLFSSTQHAALQEQDISSEPQSCSGAESVEAKPEEFDIGTPRSQVSEEQQFEVDLQAPEVTEEAEVKRRKVSEDWADADLELEEMLFAALEASELVQDDDEEAAAMVERARRACRDDLAQHLRDWLASPPAS
ncbi:unnamed protein product, partial [Polarella glacialis]